MYASKVSRGERIAAVSGAVLLLAMFLDWYGLGVSSEVPGLQEFTGGGAALDAWQSFDVIDVVLFVTLTLAIAQALFRGADTMPSLPVPPALVVALLGLLSTVLVLYRLIDPPVGDGELSGVVIDVSRKLGAFLGLAAAAGIAYGGWRALGEAGEPPPAGGPAAEAQQSPPSAG